MQYRKNRINEDISLLGYGCMRFTKKGNSIDLDKAEREIMHAINNGVNYFDTAYIYGGSEAALGEILSRNKVREKINIATKLPQYLIQSKDGIERYFNEQLKRLQTDYIDYYLMHMLTDIASWEKLCNLGIKDWIKAKKESGKIRQIGFSFHGDTDMFIKILDAYDWDFCQIQYNYMDENSQAGRRGLMAAADKNIPVIIMEPLRGGKLVQMLPDKAKKLIKDNKRGYSAAEWALRWLWEQPQVSCVLSGMNSISMLDENIRIASEVKPYEFTSEDRAVISSIKELIEEKIKVGCTGCGYCMPCPAGVDIPGNFRCYNNMYMESRRAGRHEYFQVIGLRKNSGIASKCIGCGKCEKHCPQHIKIREELKNADKELRPFYTRVAIYISRWWLHGRPRKR